MLRMFEDDSKRALHNRIRALSVAVCIALITVAYLYVPQKWLLLSKAIQYLYFLPIVVAAFWFGLRGALLAAALAALCYLPRILWSPWPSGYSPDQFGEALDLFIVGSVLGVLADRERRRSQQLEALNRQLADTYRELQDNFQHLRRAEQFSAIGQLAASLAHEIRNPLASIEGAADLLRPGAVSDDLREEFVQIIKKESKRLSRLLTDLLDFARPRPPEYQETSLAAMMHSVANLVSVSAAKQNVKVRVELPPHLPKVECDPEQIRQVVLNLTMNAVQAMPQGGNVDLRLYPHNSSLAIEVRDEGPGVPPDEIEKLFSPFYTTKKDGTGLGLAIAQKIMIAHGGLITVDNQKPHGAIFTAILPLHPSTARKEAAR
ncbi:MAG: ATP-binding protein [Bryobacteraceae bacterium]|nr:ATP-binding protein [Bryobacteraceae bacterium]MDW8377142.1 ATP-binding protein [Bryobacterales bacterium]